MFRIAQTIKIPTTFSSEGTTEKQQAYEKLCWPSKQLSEVHHNEFMPFSKICTHVLNKLGDMTNQSDVTFVLHYFKALFVCNWLYQLLLNISKILEVETGIISIVNPVRILLTTGCQCTQFRFKTISHMVSEEISGKQDFQFVSVKRAEHVQIGSWQRSIFWMNRPWRLHRTVRIKQQWGNYLAVKAK